jgi:hypothetical protein
LPGHQAHQFEWLLAHIQLIPHRLKRRCQIPRTDRIQQGKRLDRRGVAASKPHDGNLAFVRRAGQRLSDAHLSIRQEDDAGRLRNHLRMLQQRRSTAAIQLMGLIDND